MISIVTNQKLADAVQTGTAFRYAYSRAKFWKSWIWGITFVFAILQTAASAFIFSYGKSTSFDPTSYVVGLLLISVITGSFGKLLVSKWQGIGCTLQRFHDYLVMNVGLKPSHLEIPKSTIVDLSRKRLKQVPEDDKELEKWWPVSLNQVPFPVAKVIATYSTFTWENELRKKYQALLRCSLIACVLTPLVLAMVLDYTVSQAIIFILAPFTPFISVLIDEWLTNRQNINVANSLTSECHSTWTSVIAKKLSAQEIDIATEQHMNFWQNYRQTATPIFEWLYQCSQKSMEANMVIDTDELITDYINRPT